MADWILVACLKQLFTEFNQIAPGRDHASDGSIGDAAHQHEVSDHNPDETGSVPVHDADHTNEVHAIDVDVDLREPGLTMETVVQFVLARCRNGSEKRLRYIIYNRRIWEADNNWKQRAYTGASAHTEHAHFSASYDSSREASTASWHLEDIPVALTAADKTWITNTIRAEVAKVAGEVWAYQLERPDSTTTPKEKSSAGAYQRYTDVVTNAAAERVIAALQPSPLP
ncbi:hypothetical protein [Actinoplanes sp. NPDC051411]|uniref:hypothetical protein n=1 Tax=Actinoplanes sp. NPDC051411 TaxID=3155522 RepID=UPI00342EB8CA